jgi:hypothetical protein
MKLILLGGGNPGGPAAWPGPELGAGAAWYEPDLNGGGRPNRVPTAPSMRR